MRQLVCTFIAMFTLGFLLGCEDDCVCPQPEPEPEHVPDYHLLYSYVGDGYVDYVLTYSTKSGEIIDSARYDGNPFDNMVFSHDGQYACYTSNYNLRVGGSETWVTNWPQGDTVAYLAGTGALAAYLTLDDQYLLLTGGSSVALLSFPSLTAIYKDSVKHLRDDPNWQGSGSWAGAFHPNRQLVYVTFEPYYDSIFVLDYSELPLKILSHQLVDSQGYPVYAKGPLACTDEYLIIVQASRDHPGYLGLFDPITLQVIRDRLVRRSWIYSGPLHPDGTRLFLAYNSGFDWPYGGIDVYDLETDILRTYIAEGEIDVGWGGINPSDLQFTPDGRVMYMANGGIGFDRGPILEINIETREVTRRWDQETGFSRLLRLNPRDWTQ